MYYISISILLYFLLYNIIIYYFYFFLIYKKSKNKLICKIAKYTAYDNKQKLNNYKEL